jgi:hypothetical protein
MEGDIDFPAGALPDHLPRLDRGAHPEGSGQVCAMEAAAWLAGEPWSDQPRSVHPVVAHVARAVNDRIADDERQTLWPLIVASLDTARPRHPILSLRLSWYAGRSTARAARQGDLRPAWWAVLDHHSRLYGHQRSALPTDRIETLATHLKTK